MLANIILAVLAVLIIAEGLYIFFFTKPTIKIIKKFIKDKDKLKYLGLIEAVVGILLLLASIYF
jgi:uncharacterized protein YjeT (DUF2065 family)